jgi:L-ribulose-5-phosphate 3-epimerase
MKKLGVCSWSLQAKSSQELIDAVGQCELAAVQLWLDPVREEAAWSGTFDALRNAGIDVLSGMMTCIAEDYSSLDAIRRTGGVVPDETWEQNKVNFARNLDIAAAEGLKLVTFHAGFIPEEASDPTRPVLIDRLRVVAQMCDDRQLQLGFETGQEDAETLIQLLDELSAPNVVVNFDPANMILYNMDEPIEALRSLIDRTGQLHIKDATRTQVAGEWGAEVAVGDGDVDWKAFFGVLSEAGHEGPLVIEREAGEQRVADVLQARQKVVKICGQEVLL